MHSKEGSYVPLDCPMCLRMIRDTSDAAQYHESQCCVECWWSFLEPLRKLNEDEGYLPSIAELNNYREKIRNFETEIINA